MSEARVEMECRRLPAGLREGDLERFDATLLPRMIGVNGSFRCWHPVESGYARSRECVDGSLPDALPKLTHNEE